MELVKKVKTELAKEHGIDFNSGFFTDEVSVFLEEIVDATENVLKQGSDKRNQRFKNVSKELDVLRKRNSKEKSLLQDIDLLNEELIKLKNDLGKKQKYIDKILAFRVSKTVTVKALLE